MASKETVHACSDRLNTIWNADINCWKCKFIYITLFERCFCKTSNIYWQKMQMILFKATLPQILENT